MTHVVTEACIKCKHTELNGRLAEKWEDSVITDKKDPPDDYAEWQNRPIGEKIPLLEIE